MTTNNPVRASDAEREEVASIVQAAGAEGRLTLGETEDRLAGIYQTTFRHELAEFTADLPKPALAPVRTRAVRQLPRGALGVRAAVVLVLATVLIVRWSSSGVPYFWPAFPLFWLVASLAVHARIRGFRSRGSTA
jgi:hypothetical protein